MKMLSDQVYKLLFIGEHVTGGMGAVEDWHRRKYVNLVKESSCSSEET